MEAVSMQEAYSSTLKTKHFWYYQKQDAGRMECNILDMCLGIFTFIWTTYMQAVNRIEIVYKIPVSEAQVLAQVLTQAGRVIMASTNQPCLTQLRLPKLIHAPLPGTRVKRVPLTNHHHHQQCWYEWENSTPWVPSVTRAAPASDHFTVQDQKLFKDHFWN